MPQLLLILLTLTILPVAHAEMYKVVDEDGHVSYTDTPPSDQENRVESIEQKETNRIPSSTYKGELQEQFEQRTAARQAQRKEAWDSYDSKVKEAAEALKAAKQALKEGKEIGDGDRVGIVANGKQTGSRLSEQYLERVDKLKRDVEKARNHLQNVKKQRPRLMRP